MAVDVPRGRDQVIEDLLSQGMNLIPLLPKSKRPAIPWKAYQSKRYDGAIPESQNFGVVCGRISGNLFVLYIDIADPSLPDRILKSAIKRTLVVRTGSGGYHIYVRCKKLPRSETLKGEHGRVEIKSEGMYVVGPTSVHPDTGKEYEIISDVTCIAEVDFEEDILKNLEGLGFGRDKSGAGGRAVTKGNIKRGERHASAVKYANHLLFKANLDDQTVRFEMRRLNDALEEPLPAGELDRLVEDSISFHQKHPKAEQPDDKQQLTSFMQGKTLKTVRSANNPAEVYCMVESGGTKRVIELGSQDARDWLIATYYKETSKVLGTDAYDVVLKLVKACASNGGVPSEKVYRRIALVDGVLYYDLCNDSRELVRVASDSIRIVRHGEDTPMFQSSLNQSAQVTPDLGSWPDAIGEMCRLLRMDTLLFRVHLISFFLEKVATPIMLITGQQGSIKSTQSGLIKRMVDPTGSELEDNLTNFPKKLDDLCIRLNNDQVIAFDNLSRITPEQSDTLCMATTGGKITKRQLYTDADEKVLRIRRKIVINGITLEIERGDLMERIVIYQTSAVPADQMKTAAEVEEEFRRILPKFLGAVFGILQEAIRMESSVKKSFHKRARMAAFEMWGECISRALGNDPGAFQKEYGQSRQDSNDLLNEETPLAPFLAELLNGEVEIVVSFKEFFVRLKAYAEENQYDTKSGGFPKAANRLRGYITRYRPLVTDAGYSIEIQRNTKKNRFSKNARLIKIRLLSSLSSSPSPPPVTRRDDGEDGEHGEGTLEKSS